MKKQIITIKPKPPYDIRSHWETYSSKNPQPQICENGVYRRALRIGNQKLIPFDVHLNDNVNDPRLDISIYSKVTESEQKELINKIRWIFNTEYDLNPLYKFMESDPLLKEIKNKHYGLKPDFCSKVYEGTIKAIIQQQISLRMAWTMTWRVIQKFGDCIKKDGQEFWEFPSPKKLSEAKIEEIRECKLSGRKAEYIIDFSKLVSENKFDSESLKKLNHDEIIDRVTQIRGLGRWSAETVIVTSIGFENMNPAGDLGARKAISHFYNKDNLMSEEEVRKFTEKWGKYKGIINYYLIADVLH
ncbi:MAG: hypothetical protein CVT88_03365 [Candidatus Altiarchaeales archaeon HGW-Altiarchaeales-1]|nr:MAG: hypothetical protein CVT88_03365 [Candidatus Altiarchaeales archaeon HGW-Altiarchaeales-1]